MIKKTIFTTSIYEKTNFLNKDEFEQLNNSIKQNQVYKEHNELIGDAVSSHNSENNILDNVVNIKNKIQKEVSICSKIIGYDNLILTNSWSNIQRKGSILNYHCHPNSMLSGALFLKVDGFSSRIYFKNPNPIIYNLDFRERNYDNFETFSIIPQPGLLLMWPSWLMHGSNSEINNSDERVVISFNTSIGV